jgi:hypothetical protein
MCLAPTEKIIKKTVGVRSLSAAAGLQSAVPTVF